MQITVKASAIFSLKHSQSWRFFYVVHGTIKLRLEAIEKLGTECIIWQAQCIQACNIPHYECDDIRKNR